MRLTTFNPVKDALINLNGLNQIGARTSFKGRMFCWTCQKDKPAKGGTKKGHHDGSRGFAAGAPIRSTCADCVEARAAKKLLAAQTVTE